MAKQRNDPKSAGGGGKAWAGRFREKTDRLVEAFTRSVTVDSRLYGEDIAGSIAHCKTLEKARVLTRAETRAIVRGLESVKRELDRGQFAFLASRRRYSHGDRTAIDRDDWSVGRQVTHGAQPE